VYRAPWTAAIRIRRPVGNAAVITIAIALANHNRRCHRPSRIGRIHSTTRIARSQTHSGHPARRDEAEGTPAPALQLYGESGIEPPKHLSH